MDHYQPLKLSQAEKKLVTALSADVPMSAYALEKRACLPHSTTLYALDSLRRRGLVIAHQYRKRIRWTKVPDQKSALTAGRSVIVHRGKRALQTLVDDIFTLSPYARLYTLQGERSFDTWTKVLGERYIAKLNKRIKAHKIIVETVIPSELFYRQKLPTSFLKSYQGRMSDARIVPPEIFAFSSDLAMWKDRVCIMNWKEKIGIEIVDTELRKLIIALFVYTQSHARKVDVNADVRRAL